jgi:hypothetical protein
MSQIKRYRIQSQYLEPVDYVLCTDHLAAMAAASAYRPEIELDKCSKYVDQVNAEQLAAGAPPLWANQVQLIINGWLSCAKSRAKAAGGVG